MKVSYLCRDYVVSFIFITLEHAAVEGANGKLELARMLVRGRGTL